MTSQHQQSSFLNNVSMPNYYEICSGSMCHVHVKENSCYFLKNCLTLWQFYKPCKVWYLSKITSISRDAMRPRSASILQRIQMFQPCTMWGKLENVLNVSKLVTMKCYMLVGDKVLIITSMLRLVNKGIHALCTCIKICLSLIIRTDKC